MESSVVLETFCAFGRRDARGTGELQDRGRNTVDRWTVQSRESGYRADVITAAARDRSWLADLFLPLAGPLLRCKLRATVRFRFVRISRTFSGFSNVVGNLLHFDVESFSKLICFPERENVFPKDIQISRK